LFLAVSHAVKIENIKKSVIIILIYVPESASFVLSFYVGAVVVTLVERKNGSKNIKRTCICVSIYTAMKKKGGMCGNDDLVVGR